MSDVITRKEIDLSAYRVDAAPHEYVDELSRVDAGDARQFLDVGVDPQENGRGGSFIQKDRSVIHCKSCQPGIEIMGISQAQTQHAWLKDYIWKNLSPETDAFTHRVIEAPHEGYFIR